jgi:hypothetical protein
VDAEGGEGGGHAGHGPGSVPAGAGLHVVILAGGAGDAKGGGGGGGGVRVPRPHSGERRGQECRPLTLPKPRAQRSG